MKKNKANEEKKRYLQRYQDSVCQLEFCKEEMLRVRSLETQITQALSGMPSGATKASKPELATERKQRAEEHYKQAIVQHRKTLVEITDLLNGQLSGKEQLVMKWRYLSGLSWQEVADKVGISLRWVWVLHGQALERLVIQRDASGQWGMSG